MSTHPNAILAVALTPQADLARQTWKAVLEQLGHGEDDPYPIVGDKLYHGIIMDGCYDGTHQISAFNGDIVFFSLVTYGYGETIKWDTLAKQQRDLEEWSKMICSQHNCTYEIFVTANYW